jgi:hypothetical protein
LNAAGITVASVTTRVAKFWELSIHSLVFWKSWLDIPGISRKSGTMQPGFIENQGIY